MSAYWWGPTYHDSEGNLQKDPWFDGNLARQFDREKIASFEERCVRLVHSDHQLSEKGSKTHRAAQLIQFVDLLLGVTTNVLHPDSRWKRQSPKLQLTERALPALEAASLTRTHTESRKLGFAYSQFPKSTRMIIGDQNSFQQGEFYRLSPVSFLEKYSGQGLLFE